MNLISVALASAFVTFVHSLWLSDLTSSKGFDFGDGMLLRIDDNKAINSSIFDRLAIRIDYDDIGVSVGQKSNTNAMEVDFYINDKIEGRGRKSDNMLMPFVLGATGAAVMGLVFSGMKAVVLKSLLVAKIALVFSMVLLIGKLMKKEDDNSYLEVEHHAGSEVHPVYSEYPSDGELISPSESMGYSSNGYGGYPYNYGASVAAESSMNYVTVDAPGNNSLAAVGGTQQIIPAAKRRDHLKRKAKVPVILSITHYNTSNK